MPTGLLCEDVQKWVGRGAQVHGTSNCGWHKGLDKGDSRGVDNKEHAPVQHVNFVEVRTKGNDPRQKHSHSGVNHQEHAPVQHVKLLAGLPNGGRVHDGRQLDQVVDHHLMFQW